MIDQKMKITVLGWWGGFPPPGGATCGVLAESDEGCVLLDCGSGILSRFFRYSPIQSLRAVLLTHLHYDHMGDLGCLQYAVNHALRTGLIADKLPVYAPKTPSDMWNAIQYPFTETFPLSNGMEFEAAGIRVKVMKVRHTVECYAYRLECGGKTMVYFTDSVYMPEAAGFIKGADLLLCEATISVGTRHSTGLGHMTDIEAGRTAREGEAKRLCLCHLPSDGDLKLMRERASAEYGGSVLTPDQQCVFLL